jgi:hypothetical protein
MKVREILRVPKRVSVGGARPGPVASDSTSRIGASRQIPNRFLGGLDPLASEDVSAVGDPNNGVTAELSPTLDLSLVRLPTTPHSPDLEYIKRQIARLPQ